MGLELQDKAWALHAHRPEFTLTYPLDAAKKALVSELFEFFVGFFRHDL